MQIFHMLGHNANWSLDAHFQNKVGDGFIFCAYSFEYGTIGTKRSGYKPEDYIPLSMIDLQFFEYKEAVGGKLDSYPFHPSHCTHNDETNIGDSIEDAIKYQSDELKLTNIIIPNLFYGFDKKDKLIRNIKRINNIYKSIKQNSKTYYMTLPLDFASITNTRFIEELVLELSDSCDFDGFYICLENDLKMNQKVSQDHNYFDGKHDLFRKLSSNGFKTVYPYANYDAITLCAVCDINIITIGTYENLRNFSHERFLDNEKGGGRSDGYYFSEKLLNAIKPKWLGAVRRAEMIDEIKNSKNMFSDVILREGYVWNSHKPEVNKNYLVAIHKLLKEITSIGNLTERKKFTISLIDQAIQYYKILEEKGALMAYESSGEHLIAWRNFIAQSK